MSSEYHVGIAGIVKYDPINPAKNDVPTNNTIGIMLLNLISIIIVQVSDIQHSLLHTFDKTEYI